MPNTAKSSQQQKQAIKTKRLKQLWVQIWDFKFPANIQPNFSSIHPATSLEVSSSTEEVTFDDEWEYVLRHNPKNNETENYQTYPYVSTDDGSSSTTDSSSTTTNNT